MTNLLQRRAATAAGAVLLGAAEYAVLHSLVGIEVAARSGDSTRHVTLAAVVLAAAVSALAGWGLLALLERLTARARAVWTTVAVVVLLLSLALGPAGGVGAGAAATLVLLHLSVGFVLILGLPRHAPPAVKR